MCGLVGILGKRITHDGRKFVEQGLIVDTVRGKHSTGLLTVKKNGQGAEWYKTDLCGPEFVQEKVTQDILKEHTQRVALLGHNRAATMGTINEENAHPFRVGNTILMHNGTLVSTHGLPGDGLYEVDSHVLTHAIEEKGIEEIAPKIWGAFALVWYDLGTGTVNFCRNDERPLWFGKVENKNDTPAWQDNMWVYGSEKGMIKWLAERNGLKVSNWFQLKTETLMYFDSQGDFEEPGYKKLTYRKEPNRTGHHTPYTGARSAVPGPANSGQRESYISEAIRKMTDKRYKLGDTVRFWPERFIPYSGKHDSGKIVGWLSHEPWLRVHVHGVGKDRYSLRKIQVKGQTQDWLVPPDGLYRAKIMSCSKDNGEGVLLLDKTSIEIVESYPNKEEDDDKKVIELPNQADKTSKAFDKEKNPLFERSEGFLPGPGGTYISMDEWEERTKDGCSGCCQPIFEDDAFAIQWFDNRSPLCEECAREWQIDGSSALH